MHGFSEVRSIHVRDEAECHGALAVKLERFVGHDRSEVGTTDPDVHDIANAFSSVTLPRAATHALGERGHPVQNGMDLGHDIVSINKNRHVSWGTQGCVQYSPVLGGLGILKKEHGPDPVLQVGFLSELDKQINGL